MPDRPGVYLMKDRLGRIIYVGKAKSLKKRVSSYFQPGRERALRHQPKIRTLIEMIHDLEIIEVKSETEALLLEGKLIRQWRPRYNTDFTDDKRFLLVRVDPGEELPRFRLTRLKKEDRSRYFGPFAHSGLLRRTLATMRRQIEAGEVKVLAMMSEERNKALPNVPAITEILPDAKLASGFWGFWGVGGLAPTIVNRLSLEIQKGYRDPDIVAKLESIDAKPEGSTPQEFAKAIAKQMALLKELTALAGVTPQ